MKKQDRFYSEEKIIRDWNGEIVIESNGIIPYGHEDYIAIEKQVDDWDRWKDGRKKFWKEFWEHEKEK